MEEKIIVTIQKGNASEVNNLLSQDEGLVKFTRYQDGNSFLHIAFQALASTPEKLIEITHVLINHKISLDIKNLQGSAPLHLAFDPAFTSSPTSIFFIDLLVKGGANVNLQDKAGCTPLQLAARFTGGQFVRSMPHFDQICECIKILLKAGAKYPDSKDQQGRTSGVGDHEAHAFALVHRLSAELKLEPALEKSQQQVEKHQNEIKQLKVHISNIEKKQSYLSKHVNKVLASDKELQEVEAIKIQALFRGFRERRKNPLSQLKAQKKREIQEQGEKISKLFKEGKFDEVGKIADAMKNDHLHQAMQIIQGLPEREPESKDSLKLK